MQLSQPIGSWLIYEWAMVGGLVAILSCFVLIAIGFLYIKRIAYQPIWLTELFLLAIGLLIFSFILHGTTHLQSVIAIGVGLATYFVTVNGVAADKGLMSLFALIWVVGGLVLALDALTIKKTSTVNPNVLAGYFVPCVFLVFLYPRKAYFNLIFIPIAGLVVMILLVVMYQTKSLGAAGAVAIGVVAAVIVTLARYSRLIAIVFLLALMLLGFNLRHHAPRITDTASFSDRIDVWTTSLEIIQTSPLEGVGVGNYRTAFQPYVLYSKHMPVLDEADPVRKEWYRLKPDHAHNLVLQLGVEFGLPGSLVYLAIVAAVFGFAVRNVLLSPDRFSVGLFCAYLAMLAHSFIDLPLWDSRSSLIFWAVMGMIVGYASHQAIYVASDRASFL